MQFAVPVARDLVLSGLAVWAATGSADGAPCLSGLRRALVLGHFSGSVDCGRDRLTVRELGHVRLRERKFVVYDYTYKLKPVCDDCAVHGGRRILIFDRGRYLGQYEADFAHVFLRDSHLIFRPGEVSGLRGQASVVKFTYRGVPKRILADGENKSFFR